MGECGWGFQGATSIICDNRFHGPEWSTAFHESPAGQMCQEQWGGDSGCGAEEPQLQAAIDQWGTYDHGSSKGRKPMDTLRARPSRTRPVVKYFSLVRSGWLFNVGWKLKRLGSKRILISPRGLAWEVVKYRGRGWRLNPVDLIKQV